MTDTDCVIVLTTLPMETDADAFAARLVEERLAACVAVQGPVRSIYRWRDGLEHTREHQLIVKTAAARADALVRRIGELHPYGVPELLVIPVTGGGAAYLRWVQDETRPS